MTAPLQLSMPLAPTGSAAGGLSSPSGASGSFFQTTRLSRQELSEAIARAEMQNDAVLAIFRAYGSLTPSTCWGHYQAHGKRAPLTSIRRSITVLTTAGALVKTDTQLPGMYGVPERVWALA